ncbi:MAG: hypothetical protein ACRD4C_04075 [Candidatus Acidiferrales bacterium]
MKPCAALLLALAAILCSPVSRADELKLKDGTRIVGTIVGFEENSFRIKTSYGFAVVRKDQVVSVSITDANKTAAAEKKPEPAPAGQTPPVTAKTEPAKPAQKGSSTTAPKSAPSKPATTEAAGATAPPQAPSPVVFPNKPAASAEIAAAPESANQAAPPAPTAPSSTVARAVALAPPSASSVSGPIREDVIGNTYTNETYGFHMYKPPDWDVIQGARTLLPGAITAMGTEDQTTYLLIGQEPAEKSLAAEMNATQSRLTAIMDNFRPLEVDQLTVSGIPATEYRFRGTVDQQEWSGVVVFVPREARRYTIFGMTIADSDLVQIQENVIARVISSLQFTKP